ncbi:hypothetical protein MBRA1_001556 [Malassezia brasiliensis]|uniref:Uncharacterized protein n=1 Tax=Malassezia brasiliensis TaxID=1821822 RepID=A0AAF0DRW1_9BASI|nr:hypothetical protein MBRA1_001556 [Malassezia brasiliensis]
MSTSEALARTDDSVAPPPRTAAGAHDDGRPSSEAPLRSPRTPSPILGGGRAADEGDVNTTPGHLTFPHVGLGTMEQEMQLLTSIEDLDEADPLDHADDTLTSRALACASALERDGAGAADEAPEAPAPMIRALVDRVQQQQASRAHLKHLVSVTRLASLSLLSSLRISYSHMLHAEREINSRLEVELHGSKSQSRMLSDMVSRASLSHDDERRTAMSTTPHKAEPAAADAETTTAASSSPPPPAVERNKLLADKRYLRQRVHDAEAQVARLESELRALRPVLLRHPGEETGGAAASLPPSAPRTPRRQREAMMGDAKSEHLLLAARMLRTLRHATRSPSSMATDTSPSKYKTDAYHAEAPPHTPRARDALYPTTPKSTAPRPHVTDERTLSARSEPSAPLSGIDELLYAAQSLRGADAPAGGAPRADVPAEASSPLHAYPNAPVFGSPKRRRVSSTYMEVDDELHAGPRAPSTPQRAAQDKLSALDVLADQAAAHEGPHVHGHRRTHSSSQAQLGTPAWTPVATKTASASAVKPRPVGGNQSPEKRLPYVRWSAEEDTKLRRAIKEYGQRWEHVARAVGTRSYHQCRQRYLLMRRKEAAANGTASPSKAGGPNAPRTPLRTPPRPTHAPHPTPFATAPASAHAGDGEEGGSSSSSASSTHDAEAQHARPVFAQPQFASPARYDRAVPHPHAHTHYHPASSPQPFPHGRVGPALYS